MRLRALALVLLLASCAAPEAEPSEPVETAPEVSAQEDLFFRVFQTLEIHRIPAPFVYEDLQAPSDSGGSAAEPAPGD